MAIKHNPVHVFTLSIVALLATGTVHASTPVCSSIEFDTDGDGWGWENHRSCRVTTGTEVQLQSPTEQVPDNTPSYLDRHPVCTGPDADPDGDGWGWENHRPCYVLDNSSDGQVTDSTVDVDVTVEVTEVEETITEIEQTDADDSGAESPEISDVIDTNTTGSNNHPYCQLASSDPDGDGWGWENSRSCIVNSSAEEVNESTIDGLPTEQQDSAAPDAADPADTDATGDTTNAAADADPDSAKDDPSIVYSQDFESAASGLYQSDQLNEGWNQPFWHLGFDQGRVRITEDASHGQVMQVTFPAGTYGSNGASAFLSDVQFGMELPKTYDELYLTYDIMFADNFDFVRGGKLPGLCGANSDSALTEGCNTGGGKPDGFDGWSARGMWRVDGALEHYTYHAGQQNFWADSLLWNVKAQRGSWHRVQHRVVLNTVGASDGILEAWFDGQQVLSNNQIEYRKTESVGINLFYFNTFFGGNDPSWAPATDQILYFDNFTISTRKTN